jgi:flagellar motility protein MotE (MotC chaperone)
MRRALAFLVRIYAGLTAIGVAIVAVAAAALFASGWTDAAKVGEAARVLREGAPPPVTPRDRTAEEARRDEARRAAEETLARRQEELRRLEARVSVRMAQLEADRSRLEADRRRHAEAVTQFRLDREAAGPARGEEEGAGSNVSLFSRMEAAEVAEAMKGWDEARIVRTLRALRPSKAAEVLAALRTDPQFEADFRRPPPGAPRGARTRLERIFEELGEGSR